MTRPFILLLIVTAMIIAFAIFSVWCFMFLLVPVITLIIDFLNDDMYNNSFCRIAGIRTIKRIHTTHGRFYVLPSRDKRCIILVQDKFFYLRAIDAVTFRDIDHLKLWVKQATDSICQLKLEENRVDNELKIWNGHIDRQAERAEKLNDIV